MRVSRKRELSCQHPSGECCGANSRIAFLGRGNLTNSGSGQQHRYTLDRVLTPEKQQERPAQLIQGDGSCNTQTSPGQPARSALPRLETLLTIC